MKKYIIITLIAVLSLSLLNAKVFDSYEPSARAAAMGGAYGAVSDNSEGIFYNPAGLSLAGNGVNIGRAKIFGNDFQVLHTASFTMALPKKLGNIALGYTGMTVEYLDVELESEKTYSLAHSFVLNKDVHTYLSVGYSLNFHHLEFEGLGDDISTGLNIGALAIVRSRTFLGFWAKNINNPEIGSSNHHELPKKLTASIAYIPYDKVITTAELQKNLGYSSDTEIHVGTEIELIKYFKLRVGLRNYPTQYSMGFGVDYENIKINYALQTHQTLEDYTHRFSIGYEF